MRARTLVSLALIATACAGGSPHPAGPSNPAEAADLFAAEAHAYLEAELAFWPHRAVRLGYHEHDGVLPDRSADDISAEIERLRAAIERFEALEPEQLSPAQRLEQAAILARARRSLFELSTRRAPERDPRFYLEALDLSYYADMPYAPARARAGAAMTICEGAGAYLEAAQARISDEAPQPWLDAAREATTALIAHAHSELPAALRDDEGAPIEGLEEGLSGCVAALEAFGEFLDARRDDAPASVALGEEALVALFAAEGLELDLASIRAIAEAALDRDRERLAQAAEEIEPGAPVAEVVEFERMNKPAADEVGAIASHQVDEVRALASEWGLVSIAPDREIEVREAPPAFRDRAATARAPGPRERASLPAAFYITPPSPSWPEAEQEAFVLSIGDLLVTSIREAWPGRLVHQLAAADNESEILASLCPDTTRDGWAHYAEGVMWEAGLGDGEPRVHAAVLTSSILRHLRVLTVIDLHTGAISVAEAAERFEQEAYLDAATARNEALRASYDPAYAGESLGRLAIEQLRRDWGAQQGEESDRRRFHDELLSHGCAPLPAIREAMLGEGLLLATLKRH